MSRSTTPVIIGASSSRSGSLAPSVTSTTANLVNPFNSMMGASSSSQEPPPISQTTKRDRCRRPEPIYNEFYNPRIVSDVELPVNYSPYANGQPLFDDRPVVIANLPRYHLISDAAKRPNQNWVWQLGYALHDSRKKGSRIWACKLCKYIQIYCCSC